MFPVSGLDRGGNRRGIRTCTADRLHGGPAAALGAVCRAAGGSEDGHAVGVAASRAGWKKARSRRTERKSVIHSSSSAAHPGRRSGREKPLKTANSERTLPLPKPVATALTALKARQAAERLATGAAYRPSGYVLINELGDLRRPRRSRQRLGWPRRPQLHQTHLRTPQPGAPQTGCRAARRTSWITVRPYVRNCETSRPTRLYGS